MLKGRLSCSREADLKPLRVTAYCATPLAATDDWSPSLDALLVKLLLDERGLASSNPDPEEVERNTPVINENMPITRGELEGCGWYWQTSGPCYLYDWQTQATIYRRWDMQEQHLDWGGRRRNWSTSEGRTKSWTVNLYERNVKRIDWYCVGDAGEVLRLLSFCDGIGAKSRCIVRWEVGEMAEDWHLWRGGEIMRPVPRDWYLSISNVPCRLIQWAWRPPTFLPQNKAICAMPSIVRRVEDIYGVV